MTKKELENKQFKCRFHLQKNDFSFISIYNDVNNFSKDEE